jgi:nucleoside-diphosphate-sugar epimerase
MRVLITGGAGFLGRKLAARILADGGLPDENGAIKPLELLALFDTGAPPAAETVDGRLSVVTGDITDAAAVRALVAEGFDCIYHLAAVVSAGAEADFDLGYRVNLDGTRHVLEAARALGTCPRVVFASSIAAYGGELPETVTDDTPVHPQTSYGCQKSIGEYLITDYSRKGFLDGRALRLPTIVVRPGKPNKAASGFASAIAREPLNGIDYTCPVSPETRMAIMSPRTVVDCLRRAQALPGEAFGPWRGLLLSGFSAGMGEIVETLQAVAGERRLGHIDFKVDPAIQRIVDAWPRAAYSERAQALGFPHDDDLAAVLRAHIEDELDG